MSFQVVCTGCGAPSSPSVGICPFCKTVMAADGGDHHRHTITAFLKLYNEGKVERALSLGNEMLKAKPDLKKNLGFVMTFIKLLIETEAPSSKITSLLAETHVHMPENPIILDYLELIEAKSYLKKGPNDAGELMLKNLIRRNPQNCHAQFILGAHLFWTEKDPSLAVSYLETSVRLHPKFLRAWACLGAAYKQLGQEQLAQNAFLKCAELEVDQKMKQFFKSQAA